MYKPPKYNSLSPYLIVDDAQRLVDLLKVVFAAEELRRFDREDGKIGHVELRLDDSIIMISEATEVYPAQKNMLHMYVPDVFKTFALAIENGCEVIEKPIRKDGDPDARGSFFDFAGNYWAVGTQIDD